MRVREPLFLIESSLGPETSADPSSCAKHPTCGRLILTLWHHVIGRATRETAHSRSSEVSRKMLYIWYDLRICGEPFVRTVSEHHKSTSAGSGNVYDVPKAFTNCRVLPVFEALITDFRYGCTVDINSSATLHRPRKPSRINISREDNPNKRVGLPDRWRRKRKS